MALLLVVGVPVGFLALLIAASIVVDLFFSHRVAPGPAPLAPEDQLACNHAVRGLLDGLVRETAALELKALDTQLADLGAAWDAWDGDWQREWEQTGARCGFADLEGKGKGTAYDRMAWVHRSLPTTKLKFRDLMAHFSRDLGVEVAEMRGALDKSQADLARTPSAGQGKAQ